MTQAFTKKRLTRRQILKAFAALGVTLPAANALINSNLFKFSETSEVWLSAQGRETNQFSLGLINPSHDLPQIALSNFRGHGLCQNPVQTEQVVMIARRPGIQGMVMNLLSGEVDHVFQSGKDHHMQGHACFSHDGQYLFSSESNYKTGQGKIIVRETNNFKQVQEFSSHGIGPHELLMIPHSEQLVIANGGLLTHPESGRKVLNYEDMHSSLTYIDSQSGELLDQQSLEENKASIRHLDVSDDGVVAVAIQVQRGALKHNNLVELAAIHKPRQALKSLTAPSSLLLKLNDYMGSVKINSQQRVAGFTSPRGNLAMFWNIDDGSFLSYHRFHDVCGLAVSQDENYFVLSNSAGKIRRIKAHTLKEEPEMRLNFPNNSWDNHMLSVSLPS
jgi:hypothetical protein